jgi:S-adenosylmethionine:tRNA ribosyltransferase-isomerase
MKTSDFDYELPPDLIAQDPLPLRDASRLMVLDRASGRTSHKTFSDLPLLLAKGDCLVLNTSRVIPARLKGAKVPTGGAVELLLLEQTGGTWRAMCRGASLREGTRVSFGSGVLEAVVIRPPEGGITEVRLLSKSGDWRSAMEECGRVPLPPYIKRELEDGERYQTVYSEREISAAAPTAGLHFTRRLLERLTAEGIGIARLELAVGMDTFVPVREDLVEDHRIHDEWYSLDEECARTVDETRSLGGRVIAVGTTSVRVLETCSNHHGSVAPGRGRTDLFITPGYEFKVVDGLVTNFHFPRSTLIMLVCAFGGRERVLAAYAEAVRERYRFYSFGDAMLLL